MARERGLTCGHRRRTRLPTLDAPIVAALARRDIRAATNLLHPDPPGPARTRPDPLHAPARRRGKPAVDSVGRHGRLPPDRSARVHGSRQAQKPRDLTDDRLRAVGIRSTGTPSPWIA